MSHQACVGTPSVAGATCTPRARSRGGWDATLGQPGIRGSDRHAGRLRSAGHRPALRPTSYRGPHRGLCQRLPDCFDTNFPATRRPTTATKTITLVSGDPDSGGATPFKTGSYTGFTPSRAGACGNLHFAGREHTSMDFQGKEGGCAAVPLRKDGAGRLADNRSVPRRAARAALAAGLI